MIASGGVAGRVWVVGLLLMAGGQSACLAPTEDRVGDPGLQFVDIPGGTFRMGCANQSGSPCGGETISPVMVTVRPFAIMRFEVTQAQWREVTGRESYHSPEHGYPRCDTCPADALSWDEARSFCAQFGARLPTEAEWERAARAGSTFYLPAPCTWETCSGTSLESHRGSFAWLATNSGGRPRPVGTKKPNSYGLYDVLGNVSEWVEDCYESSTAPPPLDGSARTRCSTPYRIVRGGNHDVQYPSLYMRGRAGNNPTQSVGFRCAKSK